MAIVGAGYTGLWTAYYLARAQPTLRILVLEREIAGFGASGRNGGWVSGFFSGPARAYIRACGPERYRRLVREMFRTVDEIGMALRENEIDADFIKSGHLGVALGAAQQARLESAVAGARELGLGEEDLRMLSAEELAQRVRIPGARAGSFSPHVARVHPAKLLRGLASRGRAARRRDPRGHRRERDPPARGCGCGRDRAGALGRPGDRGLHGFAWRGCAGRSCR